MKNIHIGMEVWSLIHGEGYVKSYDGEFIIVDFYTPGCGKDVKFYYNGRLVPYLNANQALFFSKPEIKAEKKAPYKPYFKYMEKIQVRSGSNFLDIIVEFENEHCVTDVNGKDYLKSQREFFRNGQQIWMD